MRSWCIISKFRQMIINGCLESIADRELQDLSGKVSENLEDQDRAVALFQQLSDDPDSADTINYAIRHREVILRFGRFPHRNAILERVSTPEEEEFLQQPGSSF